MPTKEHFQNRLDARERHLANIILKILLAFISTWWDFEIWNFKIEHAILCLPSTKSRIDFINIITIRCNGIFWWWHKTTIKCKYRSVAALSGTKIRFREHNDMKAGIIVGQIAVWNRINQCQTTSSFKIAIWLQLCLHVTQCHDSYLHGKIKLIESLGINITIRNTPAIFWQCSIQAFLFQRPKKKQSI